MIVEFRFLLFWKESGSQLFTAVAVPGFLIIGVQTSGCIQPHNWSTILSCPYHSQRGTQIKISSQNAEIYNTSDYIVRQK